MNQIVYELDTSETQMYSYMRGENVPGGLMLIDLFAEYLIATIKIFWERCQDNNFLTRFIDKPRNHMLKSL